MSKPTVLLWRPATGMDWCRACGQVVPLRRNDDGANVVGKHRGADRQDCRYGDGVTLRASMLAATRRDGSV